MVSHSLYVVSMWVHLVALMLWLGGMLFLTFILLPVLRRSATRQQAAPLLELTGRRFRTAGWIAMGVLIVTGLIQMSFRGLLSGGETAGAAWSSSFGALLTVKLSLFGVIVLLSVVHDFFLGKRAMAEWSSDTARFKAGRARLAARILALLNMVLALAVVAIAVMLVRGRPW